ncbi:MAG: hypothetical protein PHQ35_07820 [Phycisphaerae bacterium]|nr:hypothetical protein [Phycisphaerae bacterium]MDD5380069.1 hypothetical protein [Phycisphaerae bacterium]
MKFKKIGWPVKIVIGIVVVSFLFWNCLLKPSILWDETFWNNRGAFFQAIGKYNYQFGRLPNSLEEMVKAGFLPEKSNIYSCPILHGTRSGKVLPYTECEYSITFDPNKIVIYVPKEVFDKWGYRDIEEKRRKWEFLKE